VHASLKGAFARLVAASGYRIVKTSTLRQLVEADGEPQQNLSAAHFHEQGMAARRAGADDAAFRCFAIANSLVPRYEPSRDELKVMSAEALAAIDPEAEITQRIYQMARAIEMNPLDAVARQTIDKLLAQRGGGADLTKMCFIFYDGERARAIHGEAYKRALEFVAISGIVGDVLEFGVLGGWSARLFAEAMRDIFNLNNLHLFDSFEGLPEYASEVDRYSYEIAGRKIWSDKMKFPDQFLAQFGQPHQWHIRDRLSEVIRADRVVIHEGFYAETLQTDLNVKAAIVHFDCDLYQSTIEVFWNLYRMDAFQDGTVMLFDDWNCNRGNPNFGQRRALQEFLEGQPRFSATPWYTYGYNAAVYILHEKQPREYREGK